MIFVNEGKKLLLDALRLGNALAIKIDLLKGATPAEAATVVWADVSALVMTFDGYAQKDMTGYSAATIDGAVEGETDSPLLTWTAGAGIAGAQTVSGIAVHAADAGAVQRLIGYEKVAGGPSVVNPADTLKWYINLFDQNFTPA